MDARQIIASFSKQNITLIVSPDVVNHVARQDLLFPLQLIFDIPISFVMTIGDGGGGKRDSAQLDA